MVSEVTRPASRPLGIDHAHRRGRFFLQQLAKRLVEAAADDSPIGSGLVMASATRGIRAALLERADQVAAAKHATGRSAPSTTGNSFWLVRSSVSIASSIVASGDSVANCVIIAAPIGTPRDIARTATSCASDAAAR